MNIQEFVLKSSDVLRRHNALNTMIFAQIELLNQMANCPVSIVLRKGDIPFGQTCSTGVLYPVRPVMTKFPWETGTAFSISDGVVVFWSRNLSKDIIYCVSHVDIILQCFLLRQELEALVATDVLTGLTSRRKFMKTLDKEIETSLRYRRSFGFLITDLDNFGAYNNSFGHQEGDQLLRLAGSTLLGNIRKTDMAGRYGGEEFAVLLLECTDRSELRICAEKIRVAYENTLCPPNSKRLVTVSIGGSLFPDDGTRIESLIEAADKRLYKAKAAGKNRVIVQNGVIRC